jgi:hypothetical protein
MVTTDRVCGLEDVMQPDPTILIERLGLAAPLIGFYDAPEPAPFEPLVAPRQGAQPCIFAYYRQWLAGRTLHLTRDNRACGGAGYSFFGVQPRPRKEFIAFLVDEEGLRASHDLMGQVLDQRRCYEPQHPHLLIGPLCEEQYAYLKSVTFYVNPDQLAALILGAYYHSAPGDPPPVTAPFGSGCSELLPLFDDLNVAQAAIGATDLAMRHFLEPDQLAFTVTVPMFVRLCALDERSFLYKPFWQTLVRARAQSRSGQWSG